MCKRCCITLAGMEMGHMGMHGEGRPGRAILIPLVTTLRLMCRVIYSLLRCVLCTLGCEVWDGNNSSPDEVMQSGEVAAYHTCGAVLRHKREACRSAPPVMHPA